MRAATTAALLLVAAASGCADIFGLDEVTLEEPSTSAASSGSSTSTASSTGTDASGTSSTSEGGAGASTADGGGSSSSQGGAGDGGSGGSGGDPGTGGGSSCPETLVEELVRDEFGDVGTWTGDGLGAASCDGDVCSYPVDSTTPSLERGVNGPFLQSSCFRLTTTAEATSGLRIAAQIGANGVDYDVPSIDLPTGTPTGSAACRVPAGIETPTLTLQLQAVGGGTLDLDATVALDEVVLEQVLCTETTPRCGAPAGCALPWDDVTLEPLLVETTFDDEGDIDEWSIEGGSASDWRSPACDATGCVVDVGTSAFILDHDEIEPVDLPAGTCLTFHLEADPPAIPAKVRPAMGSAAGTTLYGPDADLGVTTTTCQVPHDFSPYAFGFQVHEYADFERLGEVRFKNAGISIDGPCCAELCAADEDDCFGDLTDFEGDLGPWTAVGVGVARVAGHRDCQATRLVVTDDVTLALETSAIPAGIGATTCFEPALLARGTAQLTLRVETSEGNTYAWDFPVEGDDWQVVPGGGHDTCHLSSNFGAITAIELDVAVTDSCTYLDLDGISLLTTEACSAIECSPEPG
jgi:hypothetical protein